MKKLTGFLLSIILILTAVFYFSRKKHTNDEDGSRYCPDFKSKLEKVAGQITSKEPLQIVYAFPLDYGDGKKDVDLVVTELDGDFWKGKGVHPRIRYIKNLGDGRFEEDTTFPLFKTAHARHLIPVAFKEGRGFMFADHGLDQPPFPGAVPRVILKTKSGRWKEFTQELLPRIQSFNFHLTQVPGAGKNEDILVNVVAGAKKGEGSYLLKNDGHNRFTVSEALPEDLRSGGHCFMTSIALDIDGDGQNEIFLGGCDRPPKTAMAARDRILRRVNGLWEYASEDSVPLRAKTESWGTVALATGDLNHDGHTDVVAAVHNFGFTEGAIQVYLNTGKGMKFRSPEQKILEPAEPGKTSFISWVRVGDVDGDGFPEILAPITPIFKDGKDPKLVNNFALYKNIHGEHFLNVGPCLGSNLQYVSDAEFMDLNHDGKKDILLISSDGHFEIYYNRF